MQATGAAGQAGISAGHVLGQKLDSIPFGSYHILIIAVLALVGFIEGYDLVMTGALLVLAKAPLHLTDSDIKWLAVGPVFMLCLGGFLSSAVSDHWSRKTIMLIGVIATTFFTLLIPLVQSAEQLIIVRLLTGIGAGGAVSAAFPIAAELMPAQHRRTYGAIYEMSLAASFTVVPFIGGLLAGNEYAFRFLALPGGLAITVVPVLIYFVLPESPRWHLRKGQAQVAVDIVNRIIGRSGNRVPPLTVAGARRPHGSRPRAAAALLGLVRQRPAALDNGRHSLRRVRRDRLFPDFGAAAEGAERSGLRRQRKLGIDLDRLCGELLREGFHRLADGGHRATLDDCLRAHRIATGPRADAAGAPGRGFIGCRDGGGRPDHGLHRAVGLHRPRVYISEQFPTALRGRGHIFSESFARLFAGGLAPLLMEPHTGSAPIFFGTIFVVVAIGAFIPLAFGRETVGQLETVTEGGPEPIVGPALRPA
jgi:hypothetical protein